MQRSPVDSNIVSVSKQVCLSIFLNTLKDEPEYKKNSNQ